MSSSKNKKTSKTNAKSNRTGLFSFVIKEAEDSKALYHILFDNANDAVFLMDYDRFIECNKKSLEMFGCTKEQIVGQTPYELFSPEFQPDGRNSTMKALEKIDSAAKGQPQLFEWTHCKKDGAIFEVEVSLNPVELSGRTFIQAICRDITERKRVERALRESKQRFSTLFNQAPQLLFLHDMSGRIIDVNQATIDRYGYTKSELLSLRVQDIDPDITERGDQNRFWEKIKETKMISFEGRHKRKDGTVFPVEIYLSAVEINGERHIFAMANDTAERKQAQERLKCISEVTTDLIYEWDVATDHLEWFGDIDKALGYEKGEIRQSIGGWIKLIHPEDSKRLADSVELHRTKTELICEEYRVLKKDGTWAYWEDRGSPIIDENGKPIKWIGGCLDITKRKKVEEQLRLTQTAIERASDKIYWVRPDGNFVYVNEQACEALGYTRDELLSMKVSDIDPDFPQERWDKHWRELKSKKGMLIQSRHKTKDGKIFPVEIRTNYIKFEGKEYNFAFARDITERKKAEKEIMERQQQLKSLASELAIAEEQERHRIAVGIHDDIGAKLALAKIELQSLQKSVKDKNVSDSLDRQKDAIEQIIEDVRSLTFELSNPILYEVGLDAAVESWLKTNISPQKGISYKLETNNRKLKVNERIKVTIFNGIRELLTNILKHADAHNIYVYIEKDKGYVRTVIEDDGVGLDVSELKTHTTKEGGFGLFSLKERLEYLGGILNIKSEKNKGTTVIMTVPVNPESEL
ncbi:MAG: PAS domain S-box protein [Sedimentisphaerales bacterium]|nr:PAS domain S-box protein [Sedimentisphaerales bacterium]